MNARSWKLLLVACGLVLARPVTAGGGATHMDPIAHQILADRHPTNFAFVLLATPSLPAAKDIVAAFATYDPATPLTLGPASTQEHGLELTVGKKGKLLVVLVPAPVPNREADEAAKQSVAAIGKGWKLAEHEAHLLVALVPSPGVTLNAQDGLSLFIPLLAAVADASQSVGIYWGNAGATHDPKFFSRIAKSPQPASRLMLWNGVRVTKDATGRLSFVSLGMKQVGLPDLWLTAPRGQANVGLETLFDLLSYELQRGSAIPAGETVGRTEQEKLVVRNVPSPVDPTINVWRVDLP